MICLHFSIAGDGADFSNWRRTGPFWAVALVVLLAVGQYAAGDLPSPLLVHGGPTVNTSGGLFVSEQFFAPGTPINESGVSVGVAHKYVGSGPTRLDQGYRPIRFDSNGNVKELGTLGLATDNYTLGEVYAINATDFAVGEIKQYTSSGQLIGTQAVRWDPAGNALALTTRYGNAYAINASNTVAGSDTYQPVTWDANGTEHPLESLGQKTSGGTGGEALALNSRGVAAGYVRKYDASGTYLGERPARWSAAGNVQELGILGVDSLGNSARAVAINEDGTAIGTAVKIGAGGQNLGKLPVRWGATGDIEELGLLGTNTSGAADGAANAINAANMVVGALRKYDQAGDDLFPRAARWDSAGNVQELENFGVDANGRSQSAAFAINSANIAVGFCDLLKNDGTLGSEHAAYWDAAGNAVDLNLLIDPASGWALTQATGITDSGWISGIGFYFPNGPGKPGGYNRFFSIQVPATSVPEPNLATTVVVALASLAIQRRRHRTVA